MRPDAITVVRDDARVVHVRLRGEHELYGADRLAETLERLRCEGARVVVDLTEATFVDSTIAGVLLEAHRRIAARGSGHGLVVVVGPGSSRAVRLLFELAGLDRWLPVAHSTRVAVEAARAMPA